MYEGLRKLYASDFNTMNQEGQPDGSKIITLYKRGEKKTYRFRVKDLYGKNEEVLEHKILSRATPNHIKQRMREAKGHGEG